MNKKVDPRELPSLFPDVLPEDLLNDVPTGQIDVSDAVQPIPEFVESIKRFGILQPVLLCRKSEKSDQYEVLAGRRRVLAAKILGLEMIPAIVRQGVTYADARASAMTLEAQRHFNPNPVAEYQAVKKLVQDGYTLERIISTLGMTRERIEKLLQLDQVPAPILKAVQEHKVSVTTVERFAKMPEKQKAQAVRRFEKKGTITATDLDEIKTVQKASSVQEIMTSMSASSNSQEYLPDRIKALKMDPEGDYNTNKEFVRGWNLAIDKVLSVLDK